MKTILAAALTTLGMALGASPVMGVVLNEIVIDSKGGNPELEFVELHGEPGKEIGGLSVIMIEGSQTIPNVPVGTILRRWDIPAGDTINATGFYLIANERTAREYKVRPEMVWPDSEKIPNDAMTVALLPTEWAVPQDAVVTPQMAGQMAPHVLDKVALVGNQPATIFWDAPRVGPDGRYLAAGATRVRDGVNTNSIDDWALADIEGPADGCYNTPGAPNSIPDHMVSSARVVDDGSAPQQTVQVGQLTWARYNPLAVSQAASQNGHALVYVRNSEVKRCYDFEQNYLFNPHAVPLLLGRPLFFLNSHEPNQSSEAMKLGVYRVPTVLLMKSNGEVEFMPILARTSPMEIYQFLKYGVAPEMAM